MMVKQQPTEADLDRQHANRDDVRHIDTRLRSMTAQRKAATRRVDRWEERFGHDGTEDPTPAEA